MIFKKLRKWYEPKDSTPREQCPCCDYFSLPERYTYLICPICFWEDEDQDLDKLDEDSGPNHMPLREGRKNFKELGACSPKNVQHVYPESERKKYKYIPRETD